MKSALVSRHRPFVAVAENIGFSLFSFGNQLQKGIGINQPSDLDRWICRNDILPENLGIVVAN